MSKNSDLLALSSVELRRRIGSKEMSPVELMEASIARIEALNPAVNAICATVYARARREAKEAEKAALAGEPLGPLHGLPTGIKDLHDAEGLLTTQGSPLYRDYMPARDCAMVANVRKAGAIVVAKTNVPEFGAGANTRNPVWGATGNPFDTRLNAGGSSGGSAVALACDMLPVCTGSDTGGSLRIPAAYCGVVGLRPSPGVVPMEFRPLGWTPISVLGPMGRTVADTRQLFAAQVGMNDGEPLAFALAPERVAAGRPADLGGLARGLDRGFRPVSGLARDPRRSCANGWAPCATCSGPATRWRSTSARRTGASTWSERSTSWRATTTPTRKDPNSLGPNVRANYEMGTAMSLGDAAWAHAEQTRIFRRFQATFRDYDLVLSPTTPVSPRPWTELYLAEMEGKRLRNYYHWLALTYFITLATNPAISLPCGRDQAGMPFGLQVTGRFRGDLEVLDAAEAMEEAFTRIPGLGRPRPELARLGGASVDLKSLVTHPPAAA